MKTLDRSLDRSLEPALRAYLDRLCGCPDLANLLVDRVFAKLAQYSLPRGIDVRSRLYSLAFRVAQRFLPRPPKLTIPEAAAAAREADAEGIRYETALWRAQRRKAFATA